MKSARLVAYLVALSAMASGLAGCATTARYLGQHQQIGPISLLEQRTGNILMTVCEAPTKVTGVPVDPKKDKPVLGGSGRYRHGVLLQGCAIVKDFYGKLDQGTVGSASPLTISESREMLEDGVVLSDAACFNWFQQLDGARRASGTAAGFTSGITTLTNVVQGQTGVESGAIAIVAAAGRAVTDGFTNFDNNYLLAPSLPDVYEAVQQNRRQLAEEYLNRPDVRNKASAVRYLQYYERSCTSIGVQQFLAKAIQKAGEQGGDTPKPQSLAVYAAVQATASQIAYELREPAVLYQSDLVYLALIWEILPEKRAEYVAAQAAAAEAKTNANNAAAKPTKTPEEIENAKKLQQAADDKAAKAASLQAAYIKVAGLVETVADNREIDDPSQPVKRKLFAYAATRTKAPPPDQFAPSVNGTAAMAKLKDSQIHDILRDDASKLYDKLKGG